MEYTLKDINYFISKGRIIILKNDNIYDVTEFNNHPGGLNCLVKKNGENVYYDYKFHSNKAKKEWNKYYIGKLISNKKSNSFCCLIM